MKIKKILFFCLAVAVSLVAAHYRFGDSGHSIGVISAKGGKANHPTSFKSGSDLYTLISTATVIPPFRGNARVVLEGSPPIDHDILLTAPVIDLGIHDLPEFRDNTLYGLEPGDRIALWVVMRPPVLDPVCGMARDDGFISYNHNGKDFYFCGEGCLEKFKERPGKYEESDRVKGKYTLAFYDTETEKPVLSVPLIFKGKGDQNETARHH
jgi:YHS domain-containing protein